MREYKMGRGEYLEDRVPDLEALVEEYFGPVTGTEVQDGIEYCVVSEPDNPAFKRVLAGVVEYGSKKDRLAVHFEERDAAVLLERGETDAAAEAVELKNNFLEEATGRDAESRRKSLKRAVEDDPEHDFE